MEGGLIRWNKEQIKFFANGETMEWALLSLD